MTGYTLCERRVEAHVFCVVAAAGVSDRIGFGGGAVGEVAARVVLACVVVGGGELAHFDCSGRRVSWFGRLGKGEVDAASTISVLTSLLPRRLFAGFSAEAVEGDLVNKSVQQKSERAARSL